MEAVAQTATRHPQWLRMPAVDTQDEGDALEFQHEDKFYKRRPFDRTTSRPNSATGRLRSGSTGKDALSEPTACLCGG